MMGMVAVTVLPTYILLLLLRWGGTLEGRWEAKKVKTSGLQKGRERQTRIHLSNCTYSAGKYQTGRLDRYISSCITTLIFIFQPNPSMLGLAKPPPSYVPQIWSRGGLCFTNEM